MQVGNLVSRQKLTGRLYFTRTGFALVDLGNVELTKAMPKVQRSQLKKMTGGLVRVIHEEPGEVDWRWSVKLDEYANEGLQLLNLATRTAAGFTNSFKLYTGPPPGHAIFTNPFFIGVGLTGLSFSSLINAGGTIYSIAASKYTYNADTGYLTFNAGNGSLSAYGYTSGNLYVNLTVLQPQLAINSLTVSIGPVGLEILPGQSYFVGYCNMSTFQTLVAGANSYTLGVDYTIDVSSGMLTAINQIGDGSDQITANIIAPNLAFFGYTVLSNLFVRGNAQINLFDQNNEEDPLPTTAPREIIIMSSAEINTNEWPQDDGAKWDNFTVELLSYTAPTVQDRN